MKKVIKIGIVVVLSVWCLIATIFCTASVFAIWELEEECESWRLAYIEESQDVRGLAYELMFEGVYHGLILGEEWDLSAEIDDVALKNGFDEEMKKEFVEILEVLIERYNN